MSQLGPTAEALILTALLAGRYVSLHTGAPGDTGASEVAGGAYARQSATFAQAGTNPTVASNTGAIQYPQSLTDWGTITHFGTWDAASGGNWLGGDALVTPKVMVTGDIARWEIGTLTVSVN